jgi:ferric iron reductase protein FhuF
MNKQLRTLLEKEYSIHFSADPLEERSILGNDLLQEDRLRELLNQVGQTVNSPVSIEVASLFSKYYSHIVATGPLYAMSHFNTSIGVSLPHIHLESGSKWKPLIRIPSTGNCVKVFTSSERHLLREKVLNDVFLNNIVKVFNQLEKCTGVKKSLLWANSAFSIHYFYERWIEDEKDPSLKKQISEDFAYVTQYASAQVFGEESANPLNVQFDSIPHPLENDKLFRLRKKCCLRYLLPDSSPCTTCPRLTEGERQTVMKQYNT